jgi:hypothetical protein
VKEEHHFQNNLQRRNLDNPAVSDKFNGSMYHHPPLPPPSISHPYNTPVSRAISTSEKVYKTSSSSDRHRNYDDKSLPFNPNTTIQSSGSSNTNSVSNTKPCQSHPTKVQIESSKEKNLSTPHQSDFVTTTNKMDSKVMEFVNMEKSIIDYRLATSQCRIGL